MSLYHLLNVTQLFFPEQTFNVCVLCRLHRLSSEPLAGPAEGRLTFVLLGLPEDCHVEDV